MSPEKMVMMANQIATFFDSQPGDPAEKIAGHLRDYWEPRMRAQLLTFLETGGQGLKPSAEQAARLL
ncbi:formate dehydrogenase subunit delta [Paracoccus nototheniae]|uniref:Formate dehydrogenase subunit delta n=1 Tax=Paracoccus nototheniae TaxID=2489002 RepID=A0ABW4DYE4_9RHOB|nr:formate dehydrogenase subunit delta [Paracoccus nototheniae]